jgi:F0F1-type ATP synthase assembly protein I
MLPNNSGSDGRSDIARGYVLASRVTGIGMQMAIPPGIGWWLDGWCNTTPWILVVGVVFGFAVSLAELIQLANEGEAEDSRREK